MSETPKGNKLREYGETAEEIAIELLERLNINAIQKEGSFGKPDLYCLLYKTPCHIEVKRMRLWYLDKERGRVLNHLNISKIQLDEMLEKDKLEYSFFLILLEFTVRYASKFVPLVLFPQDVQTSASHVTKGTTYYSVTLRYLLSKAFPLEYLFEMIKPASHKLGQKTLGDFKTIEGDNTTPHEERF
ncbi:MAG: hypothetical protein ACW98X_17800 [Promethearchaeota archaeon]|jgi:hypothetical protein